MIVSMNHLPAPVQTALRSDMTIDITTTGRRSGRARRVEIWFLNVDDRIYITGTPGPRDWFANVVAEPRFVFHLKESVEADLAALARPVSDETERRAVFEADVAEWYRDQSDIDDLVASAPLIRVEFPRP
jgi:deazaflavin-dependent oxidoreductase (nitroreductase family)